MRVLVLEPGYSPYTASFRDEAEATKKVVQGNRQMLLLCPSRFRGQ